VASGKRHFDLKAVTWDEEPRRVQLAKDLFAAITDTVVLNPCIAVLDFGCGTGLLTLQLATQGGHVTGVDSSQGMLDVLEDKVRHYQNDNVITR